nr:inverse autotransporter beta domain-containing protein [Providencia alcalifaciens]
MRANGRINTTSGHKTPIQDDVLSLPLSASSPSFAEQKKAVAALPAAESPDEPLWLHDDKGSVTRHEESLSALPTLGEQDNTTDNQSSKSQVFSQGVLPTMDVLEHDKENNKRSAEWVAMGASQTGQLLSAEDTSAAALGYARSLGENVLNQQVNDWLNMVSHARIQFSSDKASDVDVLVPLVDTPESLLFSQIGLRANKERTTTNLGLGYRQHQDGWMWGGTASMIMISREATPVWD